MSGADGFHMSTNRLATQRVVDPAAREQPRRSLLRSDAERRRKAERLVDGAIWLAAFWLLGRGVAIVPLGLGVALSLVVRRSLAARIGETVERAVVVIGTARSNLHWAGVIGMGAARGLKLSGRIDVNRQSVVELRRLLHERSVGCVILCTDGAPSTKVAAMLRCCEIEGIEVWLLPSLPAAAIGRVELESLNGQPMVAYRSTPAPSWRLAAKRAIDLGGAALGLAVLGPFVLLPTAIAIRLTSRGPIFFRQMRCGRHGRPFAMYKFRSMIVDAEAQRAQLQAANETDGPVFKMKHDPRVTAIGRVLRKLSIDELPQLFNVMRGEMSLVGPRPAIPAEVAKYEPWQRRRLSVTPGLTCIWQVSGRNRIGFDRWMELDLQYIDSWSISGDLQLILKTIPVAAVGYGAS